jgi:hypothetical protein
VVESGFWWALAIANLAKSPNAQQIFKSNHSHEIIALIFKNSGPTAKFLLIAVPVITAIFAALPVIEFQRKSSKIQAKKE